MRCMLLRASISIPTSEMNWSIESVFDPIMEDIDSIQTYDALMKQWLYYSPEGPVWMNSLNTIDNTMGIWVHVTSASDVNLPLIGAAPSGSTLITLTKGWNLVGYPSFDGNRTISQAFAGVSWDIIQLCDQTRPYNIKSVPGSIKAIPGRGYWVHATEDCIWTIAA